MARPLRIEFEDGVYHVTARGTERRKIVRDADDCRKWFELFDRSAARRQWQVYAVVLMTNHFHIFLRTPLANLSAGMHDVCSGYATCFNRRHRRAGPLFQGRFKSIVVERDAHLLELSRYVHLNPVKAGLTKRLAAYQWSSYKWYVEPAKAPPWLAWQEVLSQYGEDIESAVASYVGFLKDGLRRRLRSPLKDANLAHSLATVRAFIARNRNT